MQNDPIEKQTEPVVERYDCNQVQSNSAGNQNVFVDTPGDSTGRQADPTAGQDDCVEVRNDFAEQTNRLAPTRLKPKSTEFLFGPYVPIIKTQDKIIVDNLGVVEDYYKFTYRDPVKKRLVGEILPGDSIVDAPSLVAPLLLKKQTIWPPKDRNPKKVDEDDVEVIKIVRRVGQQDVVTPAESRYRRREDYIKDTVVNSFTNNSKNCKETILAIEDYYSSPASQLLLSIGLSLVAEFNMEEQLRKLNHRMRRGENGLISEYDTLKADLLQTKNNNRYYKTKRSHACHNCSFRSDFALVLDQHLEIPHKQSSRFYLCNWCTFRSKDSTQIIYHNHVVHQKYRCRIEKPLQVHCCRYCSFETNSKRKYTAHIGKCEKTFQSELNLAFDECDYPGVTSKCIDQYDIRTYELTLKALRLAAYNPHQITVSSNVQGLDGLPILLIPKSSPAAQILNRVVKETRNMTVSEAVNPYHNPDAIIGKGMASINQSSKTDQDEPARSNLLRLLATSTTINNLPVRKTMILQHPRPQSAFVNGMSVAKNTQNIVMPPRNPLPKKTANVPDSSATAIKNSSNIANQTQNQTPASHNNNDEGTFVICEICDAYIDNVSFFKSHMQWVHKVKIHTKVLETLKPPLNCQKCNWRYFTDQGLERHLLGSHGLVTTNMQDLADHDKDSGRCTICGVRCASKLVSHIKDIHKINLKPAQLSYKCTVCAATFCLYRHFENHVYRVHG
jgi:hypothetical protein